MSVSDAIGDLTSKLGGVYKELVTNTVRFEELQKSTDRVLTKYELVLERLTSEMKAMRDDHVREVALLRGEVKALDGRLSALSEQALHAVMDKAAREIVRDSLSADTSDGRKRAAIA